MNLNFLPANVRAVVYGAVVIVALVVSCAQKGFETIQRPEPLWLAFSGGALGPLAAAVGVLALANVTTNKMASFRNENTIEGEVVDDESSDPVVPVEPESKGIHPDDEEARIQALTDGGVLAPEGTPFAEQQSEQPK